MGRRSLEEVLLLENQGILIKMVNITQCVCGIACLTYHVV